MPHPQRATTGLAVGPRCGASKAMYGHGWLWPKGDMPAARANVCFSVCSGLVVLTLSSSARDPKRKSQARLDKVLTCASNRLS
jgi:hypothetical protein